MLILQFCFFVLQFCTTNVKIDKPKFITLYVEGFAECTYLQFQTSQTFALDGGIFFDILANSNESHADGVFISEIKCSAIRCLLGQRRKYKEPFYSKVK